MLDKNQPSRIFWATDTGTLYMVIDNEWVPISNQMLQYVHDQAVASDTWVVAHNLGRYPSVAVVDSAGTVVNGKVTYNTGNQITIEFSAAFGGKAYLV